MTVTKRFFFLVLPCSFFKLGVIFSIFISSDKLHIPSSLARKIPLLVCTVKIRIKYRLYLRMETVTILIGVLEQSQQILRSLYHCSYLYWYET